jgi:hypothetical protein
MLREKDEDRKVKIEEDGEDDNASSDEEGGDGKEEMDLDTSLVDTSLTCDESFGTQGDVFSELFSEIRRVTSPDAIDQIGMDNDSDVDTRMMKSYKSAGFTDAECAKLQEIRKSMNDNDDFHNYMRRQLKKKMAVDVDTE